MFMIVSASSIGQEKVQLRWNPSTDNVGVEGYNIWLNAEYYGTTSDTFFIFPTLEPREYTMAVSAFDAAGNESEQSLALIVIISDITNPTIPDSLMLVYPNPTYNGNFIVQFGKRIRENTTIQILTPDGKIIHERLIDPLQTVERFEMKGIITPGIYILSLLENGKRIEYSVLTVGRSPVTPPVRSVGLYRQFYKGVWQISPDSYGKILAVWK